MSNLFLLIGVGSVAYALTASIRVLDRWLDKRAWDRRRRMAHPARSRH